jgi:UDP-N-acetylmuramoylalanine-D-glutamate ligase
VELAGEVEGRLVTFSIKEPSAGVEGTFLHLDDSMLKGRFLSQKGMSEFDLIPREAITLRGEHNLANVPAACAAAAAGLL